MAENSHRRFLSLRRGASPEVGVPWNAPTSYYFRADLFGPDPAAPESNRGLPLGGGWGLPWPRLHPSEGPDAALDQVEPGRLFRHLVEHAVFGVAVVFRDGPRPVRGARH